MRNRVESVLRRLLLQECGNVLIEFALALPVVCLMLAGTFDLGRYALQKSALLEGARAGAQYGVLAYHGATSTDITDSNAINTTAQNASGLGGVTATDTLFCECTAGTTVSCTTTCGGSTPPKTYLTVTASKAYSSVVGPSTINFGAFGSWSPPTSMSASITMIVP